MNEGQGLNQNIFQTSIVIPAFNEQDRLPLTLDALQREFGALSGIELLEVIVVDDGSVDETASVAARYQKELPGLVVHRVEANRGKGFAVRSGIGLATSTWVLIADADMSTPWAELVKLAHRLDVESAQIAIGSRDLPDSEVTTRQSFLREHLGKAFNVLIRVLTALPFRDTQCGFKLIHRESVQSFLPRLSVDRFAWDVEFLILARDQDLRVVEVPVVWEHRDASRVHPLIDGFDMARTVIGIQLRRIFFRS